jgi:hypothetical protein
MSVDMWVGSISDLDSNLPEKPTVLRSQIQFVEPLTVCALPRDLFLLIVPAHGPLLRSQVLLPYFAEVHSASFSLDGLIANELFLISVFGTAGTLSHQSREVELAADPRGK